MSEMSQSSLSHLMQATTKALYDCQQSLNRSGAVAGEIGRQSINAEQAEHLMQLMETLVDTRNQLTKEISTARFSYIDPKVVNDMKVAIEMAISNPLDAKVNQVYFSIFGYNSTLWNVLKEMQKLLKTVEFMEEKQGRKVDRINKSAIVKRKKKHEKNSYWDSEKEEK